MSRLDLFHRPLHRLRWIADTVREKGWLHRQLRIAPTDLVLDVIRVRVIAMRKKKGRLDDDDDDDDEPPEPHLQMAMRPTRGPVCGARVDEPPPGFARARTDSHCTPRPRSTRTTGWASRLGNADEADPQQRGLRSVPPSAERSSRRFGIDVLR